MLEKYINKTIGLAFRHKGKATDLIKGLPFYLKSAFNFSLIEIEGQEFILLVPVKEADSSTLQIIKFAKQIQKLTAKQTLMQFDSMDSGRRRTLINNRENFIFPGKQIYIPSFCMYLNENYGVKPTGRKDKLSPASQIFLLYHLQKQSFEGMPFKYLATLLNYSKKTISLVVAELMRFNLCEVKATYDRNKEIIFRMEKRALWDEVLPLMDSPIHKVWYIQKENIFDTMPLFASFDTALAHYTFMAESSQNSYAVDKKVFAENQLKIKELLSSEEGNIRLEVWKYNPEILANDNFVDCLSLALCYKDTDDERVKKEITKLIDKLW